MSPEGEGDTLMIRNKMISALAGAALATASIAATAATELKYNTLLPATHVLIKDAMAKFSDRVAADSNGDVTFKMLPGGAVSKPGAALDTMRDGIVGSAMVVDLYVRKSLPMNSVISDLALLGTDTLVMSAATNEQKLLRCDECRREMIKASSIPLVFVSTTPYMLMCKNEVTSLDKMKNLKVRATGPWAMSLKHMGMVPVNVPSTETYEAMQRGQVDCTSGSDAWLKSYTLWDVAKVVTDFPIGTYHGNLVLGISVEAWNGLSPKGKQAIRKNLATLATDSAFGYEQEKAEARKGAAEKGVKFVKPGKDFVDAYNEYSKGEVERVIVAAEKAGLKNARAVVADYLKTIAKWEKIVASTKGERKAYTEALDREIFSKLNLQ